MLLIYLFFNGFRGITYVENTVVFFFFFYLNNYIYGKYKFAECFSKDYLNHWNVKIVSMLITQGADSQ